LKMTIESSLIYPSKMVIFLFVMLVYLRVYKLGNMVDYGYITCGFNDV
jgi:type II secretory pathway component PulF